MVLGAVSGHDARPAPQPAAAFRLPAFMVRGAAKYSSAVSRPLWARYPPAGRSPRRSRAAPRQSTRTLHPLDGNQLLARWQNAVPLGRFHGLAGRAPARAAASLRYQAAQELERATGMRIKRRPAPAPPLQRAGRKRCAGARAGGRAVSGGRAHAPRCARGGRKRPRAGAAPRPLRRRLAARRGRSRAGRRPCTRCRAARSSCRRGDPCYVPSTTLVFSERQRYSTTLIFICERHQPSPRHRRNRRRAHSGGLHRAEQHHPRALGQRRGNRGLAFSMSLDADSWTWRWNATLPGSAWPVIRRGIHAAPVDILATVNGVPYRLSATDCSRDRRFAGNEGAGAGQGPRRHARCAVCADAQPCVSRERAASSNCSTWR
jgi:hypothetical protein